MGGEDRVSESGRAVLDDVDDGLAHVAIAPRGDMTIGPHGVFPVGGAGLVEERVLREQDVGPPGMDLRPRGALALGDLFAGAPEVHGPRARTRRVAPRDGLGDREVDLADAGAVPVALERARIAGGEAVTGEGGEARGCELTEDGTVGLDDGEVVDADPGADDAALGDDLARERVRDRLGPPLGKRPAPDVGGRAEHHPDGRGREGLERQHRVRGEPGEHRAPPRTEEPGKLLGGPERAEPEARERDGPAGEAEGAEDLLDEAVEVVDDGAHQALPARPPLPDGRRGLVEVTREQDGVAVVEGVREGDVGMHPREPLRLEVERAQRGRGDAHGVDGRADVVGEAVEGERGGPRAAPDGVGGLVDDHGAARVEETKGGDEAVDPAADDRGVEPLGQRVCTVCTR